MSQSGIIFGVIILAFFVYVTRKGELPTYAGLLLLSPGGAQPAQSSSAASGAIIQGALAAFGG